MAIYLTQADDIRVQILQLSSEKVLWLDTEIAHWHTAYPKLSLIQALADPIDLTGSSTVILDVLDQPELVKYFITTIILNPDIEKIFHNASFDLRYLGGEFAKNITCTLKLARKIGKQGLQVSNLQLKTLAVELCNFSQVDTEEGKSDWAKRPLTQKQLYYAAMDTVYLAAVHRHLLKTSGDIVSMGSTQSTTKSEKSSLTVTKVRIAFECPRLFYLKQHFGGSTLFLPPDTTVGVGNIFHELADEFVSLALHDSRFQDLFKPGVDQLQVEAIATDMQHLFYEIKFYSYLQKKAEIAPALLQVWKGLQGLIKRFAEILVINRKYCSAETVISNTFITTKNKLEYKFSLPDQTQQRVVGEFDCLIFNCEHQRLSVLEFKTYQPADPSAQLAQVALYSYMLWEKQKVPIDSVVYCVLPEFKEYKYTWEELEKTVHQLIPYKLQQMRQWLTWEPPHPNPPPPTTQTHLCVICPQQQKCQSYFETQKLLESDEQTEKNDPDAIGENLVATLQSFGINVDYHGAAIGPAFIRVKLKPHLGIKVNSLLRLSADLQVQLGLANPPLIEPQAGYVSVDLPRPDRQIARFENYVQSQTLPANAPVKIAIGVNLEGKLIEADLSDPNTCHFLVGGTTGSGKSEFLRSLLLSLILRHSPQDLKIALVDPKRVTFPEFERMRWLYSPVVKDSDRAIRLMEQLVTEMESRFQRFEKASCADLKTYNQRASQPLPRIVCIFDEYADFMAEKETRTALEQSIKRLGAMARAGGIHLIIATQRPEASIVTPIIRSNLPGRVALRTASEADSTIILGGKQTAASQLLGKGDLLYLVSSQLYRLQSLFAANINETHLTFRPNQASNF